MNEANQTNLPPGAADEQNSLEILPPWKKPTLTFVGHIRDIVQGGGKSGANLDADPQSTSKPGAG